jgi:TetR/AcrR family transcriptional regulator, fatty acid metabolism regulator protein
MGKKKPRTMTKEERFDQILAAAREEFSEKGYHNTSVSDIVKRCGVAQGTFYLYFKSKREIFGSLLSLFMASIYSAFFIPGAGEVNTEEDVKDRFTEVSHRAIDMLKIKNDLARLFMLEAAAREPGFEDEVYGFYEELIKQTADNLQIWMDKGLLRRADPLAIAHCVVGMIERLALQHLSGKVSGDFDKMVDEVVKFELYGILANPGKVFSKEV